MFKKALLGLLLLGLFIPTVSAQTTENVDTVILASTENYPDALVAGSAAAKIGAPVLLTDEGELTEDTRDALNQLDAGEVLITGGEEVISSDVVSTLESEGYNVTRLWGTTRYGTSVEVAGHFWAEGAEEAVLVQNSLEDENGNVLAAAKELARDETKPVYLTPEDSVPAVVLSSLESLGVGSVTVVGTTVSDSYRQSLDDIGVSVSEEITGESEQEVERKVRERLENRMNASTTLMVVASNNFRHHIAASNLPDHHVVHVSEEEGDVDDIVEMINERGVANVKVVGQPDLAEQTASTLRADTDADITVRTSDVEEAARMNANVTIEERPAFAERHDRRMQRWEEARQEHMERVQTRANNTINKADRLIDENSSEEAREHLREARLHYSNGDYFEAMEEAREAINEVREQRFEEGAEERAEAIREAMADETEALQERVEELRELNREFAEEMEENMTVEERLEVIEEFRHERRETVRDLVEEARKNRAERNEDMMERLHDARNRIRDRSTSQRFEFEAECTDESADGITVTRNSITGHDGDVRAKGRLLMPTPNYRAEHSFEESGDHEVTLTVTLSERDSFGVQCVGVGEYEYRVDRSAGNWTVNFILNADGEEVYRDAADVTVVQDDEDDETEEHEREREEEDEMERNETMDIDDSRCRADVEHAKEADDDRVCTEQFQRMECPYDDSYTYGAANGCQISHLEEDGWTATSLDDENDTETSETDSTDDGSETHTVTYDGSSFSPERLEIDVGDTVVWEATVDDMWVASDVHPTHTEYDGTSTSEHCPNEGDVFDQCDTGDRYKFTFEQTGEWSYHDHYDSSNGGTIVVQ